jgi:hypothetical protein
MGMPFPIGVAAANAAIPDKIAWLWAVNGCFSVLGSVIALIISIAQGLTFSMSVGVICYAAAIPFVVFRKRA